LPRTLQPLDPLLHFFLLSGPAVTAFLQTVRTDSSGLLRTSTISSGFCHGCVPFGFLLPNFFEPPLFF
jgi:hypothetical protein